MNTGKKIKLIRTFRGLTQKELGEACGIHEVAIRKYELGKNLPKPEQLRKIADALGVNVNSLMEFDIEADGDVLPLLFAIDETFDISIKDLDGEPGIFFSNKNLVQFLKLSDIIVPMLRKFCIVSATFNTVIFADIFADIIGNLARSGIIQMACASVSVTVTHIYADLVIKQIKVKKFDTQFIRQILNSIMPCICPRRHRRYF